MEMDFRDLAKLLKCHWNYRLLMNIILDFGWNKESVSFTVLSIFFFLWESWKYLIFKSLFLILKFENLKM